MTATILIVDDEKNTREGLREALESLGYLAITAGDGLQAEDLLRRQAVDLVLADLKMPGMDGLELLGKVQVLSPASIFIIMTAYGTVETAVEAMKRGAYDYLTKPVNLDQLELLIERALKKKSLEDENIYLKEQLEKRFGFENLLGRSAAMEKVYELIRQIRNSPATVLISGDSGTGKELVARAIHQQSPRRRQPFYPVHCASLAPTLLESELLGHERGAFTGAVSLKKGRFELADGGTIFLDEVGEIPTEIQVKLLRVLETLEFERVGGTKPIKVDVRVLAATNCDLEKRVREGSFREDFYYRLNVVRIHLPPLRERQEDIPLLIDYFIRESNRDNNKEISSVSSRAMHLLQAYDWPGNVRELKNCVESMVVLAKTAELDVDDLPPQLKRSEADSAISMPQTLNLQDQERDLILKALLRAGDNKSRAAGLLGISRRTLYRKIEEYGIKAK